MSRYAYGRGQRALEYAAIALFALLALWGLARLAAAAGWALPALVLAAAPLAWLASDLLSGLLHWACDSFGSAGTPLIGRAFIAPFRAHHADPEGMTRHDFVETHGASCLAALPLLVAALLVPPGFAQALLLLTALGALATNQCHKWAHMAEGATPRVVHWLQRRRIVLPREEHRRHHTAPFDTHFCMSCGWLNGSFDRLLRAWR
jgi:ubiquitin-conjugating enzyme E2 variant